jgi:teichuronic acid biosynthesis glycosyltransferase TuaH
MRVNSHSINKQNIDIVCFSLSRWDAPISSPALSLAKEFGKTHRVFYIEHPYSWKDYFMERGLPSVRNKKDSILKGSNIYYKGNGFSPGLIGVTPKVVYSLNFLPQGLVYDHLSELNNSIVLKTLRKVIQENNITEYIFINFFDPFFLRKIPEDIAPLLFIYQCMDDLSQVTYTSRHGVKLEEEIIKNSDYTICTSRELTRLKSAISPNVRFLANGADVELFTRSATQNLKRPDDMPDSLKKIIGFTGSIEYRMDFDLLKKMALHHSDKIIFLIGPVIGNEHITAGIDKLSNVVFAGPREITDLPAYLKYFDCAIIPYKKNELTASIYPLKINEYLAAGKPVVSTGFSEDVSAFNEVAYIEEDHDNFIRAIDRAINEDDAEKKMQRMNVAGSNSWAKRVEQFWEIIS